MEIKFFSSSGAGLFVRHDLESGHWVQEEMNVECVFPYIDGKVVQIGQKLAFNDPATGNLEVFEVRKVTNIENEHYQQVTAESIVISELSDDHIDSKKITDQNPTYAMQQALQGTLWSVGNVTASNISSCDIGRGSVWQAINIIQQNWNVYITPRITLSGSGSISGRYLDCVPAGGTFRGIRLSIDKNMADSSVAYDDTEVYTALYGYGGNVDVPQSEDQPDETEELTFADVVWTATSSHPAKPAGQKYLEWPEKTALYGRNGRPRFGYYQNGSIEDAQTLLQKTWETLQKTCEPKISITGTVVDLYRLGYKDEPLRLHDIAIVEVSTTGEKFFKEIIKLDVDLIDPTASRPEIGDYIPNIIYISRNTYEAATGDYGGPSGSKGGQTKIEYTQAKTYTDWVKLEDQIGMVVGRYNGQDKIEVGHICLSINDANEGIAWINADHVNISGTNTAHMLAGEVEYDAQGRFVIKNAGGVYVKKTEQGMDAYYGLWYEGNFDAGLIVQRINGETNAYLNADHVNISATNSVHTLAGDLEHDANGNLIIKNAGGMYVRRTESGITSEFGVYDNGNLTGGVVVDKINDGTTTTRIKGTRIIIGDDPTAQDAEELPDWIDTTEGVIAEKATIVNLNAVSARVGTIEADYLKASTVTADYLAAKFANTSVLSTKYIYTTQFEIGSSLIFDEYTCYVPDALRDLQITQSGNTYTLQRKRFTDDTWIDVGSFSRATSLSGSWSGGTYTVAANPQGNTTSTTVFLTGASSITSNGTYTYNVMTYDSEGNPEYIGAAPISAVVNVPASGTSLSGSWSGGTYTVAASPQGNTISTSIFLIGSTSITSNGDYSYQAAIYDSEGEVEYIGADISVNVAISHSPVIDQVWTSSGIPSGATQLNSLKTQYENAKADGDNFLVRVKCGGTTRTYYCTP